MDIRFKVIDTDLIDEQGNTTGKKKYRIVDSKDVEQRSKHGVYEEKAEADSVCSRLNAEHAE